MENRCKAALNIAGEHVPCTKKVSDGDPLHNGWAHSNAQHEVIWRGHDEPQLGAAVNT